MSPEPKPCPLCGHRPRRCGDSWCSCETRGCWLRKKIAPIEKWNIRAQPLPGDVTHGGVLP